MRCRWWAALAIVACSAVAQEPEKPDPKGEDLDLGYEGGRLARGERDGPAVFVRVREGGVLLVKVGEEWKEATLDGLGTFLAENRNRHDREQRLLGKSGRDEVSPGIGPTRLFLSLDVEPGVPWQHVHWVMLIAAEQFYRKLEMCEGKRTLIAMLPPNTVIEPSEDDRPPPEVKASVHVVARGERPAKWGDLDVLRPTEVRYRCGDKETADLAEVTRYLQDTKKAAAERKEQDLVLYGRVLAGHKVPYPKVFDVMEAFVAVEIENVDLLGPTIPSKQLRQVQPLPYPAKNYAAGD